MRVVLTVVPTVSFIVAPSQIAGAAEPAALSVDDTWGTIHAEFSSPVTALSSSAFDVHVQGSETRMDGSVTCFDSASDDQVDCSSASVDWADFTPFAALIPGQRYTVDLNTDGAAPSSLSWRHATLVGAYTPTAVHAWQKVSDDRAEGGSYKRDCLRYSRAWFRFSGTSITWISVYGPAMGTARVVIDGVTVGTFDNYRSNWRFRDSADRTFTVAPGDHLGYIEVTGSKNSASSGTCIAINALKVGGTLTRVSLYDWARGSYGTARAVLTGQSLRFTFHGAALRIYMVRGPSQGKVRVRIDSSHDYVWDNYSSVNDYDYSRTITWTSEATRTVRIDVTHTKNTHSAGYYVGVAGFKTP